MRDALRVCTVMALVLLNAVSAAAQAKEPPDPPTLLVIYREEVSRGKPPRTARTNTGGPPLSRRGRPRRSGSG